MRFYARLRKHSSIHTDWHMHSRLSGYVDGILFRLKGSEYVAEEELESEQVDKIRSRADQQIILEAVATPRRRLKV